MSAKYTPGPWEVDFGFNDIPVVHRPGDEIYICTTPLNSDETRANARLIAAAPELLAALEWCVDALETETGGLYRAHIAQARAAIAKAKGV